MCLEKEWQLNRHDLNRRILAVAGAMTVVSGAGALLPTIANADKGEVTIKSEKYRLKSSDKCTEVADPRFQSGDVTVTNDTDKPLDLYNNPTGYDPGCTGEDKTTVAPGETTTFSVGMYGFSFVTPAAP